MRAQVAQHLSLFDLQSRRRMALWLQHMLALELVRDIEVAEALSHPQLSGGLNGLYCASLHRLVAHLGCVTASHACGCDQSFQNAVTVSLTTDIDSGDPAISLRMNGYLEASVASLHTLPTPLATMAYHSLCLVSSCFVPLLLPHDLWAGEGLGWHDEYREEYAQLSAVGGLDQLDAVTALLDQKEFFYFSKDRHELIRSLEYAQEMFDEQPAWMRSQSTATPVREAHRLQRQLSNYTRRHGQHAWGEYIKHVCSTVRSAFRDDRDFRRYRECSNTARLEYGEGCVPIFQGLWANSGAHSECNNAEDLFTTMGQAGEEPVERLSLARVAGSQLRRILDHMAIGIGLLLRAAAVNTQVQGRAHGLRRSAERVLRYSAR